MASVLQIEQLKKSFGERLLFEGLTLNLDEGEKVAVVAVNGAGKSTLLNIIAGVEDYQAGQITFRRDLRVGYLWQNPAFKEGQSVLEACLDADTKAKEAITRYERAIATGEGLEDLKRAIVAKLEEKVGGTDSGEAPEGDVVALREALALLGGGCETRGMRPGEDLVLLANAVRAAAERLGTAVGATYSADLLDTLFSRFCVGK